MEAEFDGGGAGSVTPSATVTRVHRRIGLLRSLLLGWMYDGPRAAGRRATSSTALWDPDLRDRARQEIRAARLCLAGAFALLLLVAAVLPVAALPLVALLAVLLVRRRMAAIDSPVTVREAVRELEDWGRRPSLMGLATAVVVAAGACSIAGVSMVGFGMMEARRLGEVVAVFVAAWPAVPAAAVLVGSLAFALSIATAQGVVRAERRSQALREELGPSLRGALGLTEGAEIDLIADALGRADIDLRLIPRPELATDAVVDLALARAGLPWVVEQYDFPRLVLRRAGAQDEVRRRVLLTYEGLVIEVRPVEREPLPESVPAWV